MLIEYTVKNFRSFRDEVVLSMVADKNRELADSNTFQVGDTNVLKVAALYGSNASGKSNLIESFRFFGFLFRPGAITKKTLSDLPYFRLNAEGQDKPISYEISFFLNVYITI